MRQPRLIDIGSNINKIDKNGADSEVAQVDKAKNEHTREIEQRKREILDKIGDLQKKLKKHELKEGMLDMIISQTYRELEELKPNEYTRRGQKQSVLIKQMEALSILHDTILKYEGMIQAYQKILIDIENNKLNTSIKIENLKKEEEIADEGIGELLMTLQNQIKTAQQEGTNNMTSLVAEIEEELKDGDY